MSNLSKRSQFLLVNHGEEGPGQTEEEKYQKYRESPLSTNTKMSRRGSLFSLGAFLVLVSMMSSVNNLIMHRRVLVVDVESIDGAVREPIDGTFRENSVRKHTDNGKNTYDNKYSTYTQAISKGNEMHSHDDTPINTKVLLTKESQRENGSENEGKQNDQGQLCPSVIRKKVGLFDESSSSPVKDEFPDTILLVSSNYAYYNMLQNWEFLANELDLKWAVLALDEKLYEELGPERAVAPQASFSVSGAYGWRQGQFQTLSCNKMRMALEIANNCNVNVVFTDVDNIFLKNPFEHDLGRLIRSNRFDYLYQPNEISRKSGAHQCINGKPPKENNTGFYFVRHGNEAYKRVVESTLERCQDPENNIDDQTLFWEEFWKVKKRLEGKGKGPKPIELTTYHHCGLELEYNVKVETNSTFNWCCLDPYHYPIGKDIVTKKKTNNKTKNKKKNRPYNIKKGPYNKDPVTYHANHARSYNEKVKKLINARKDKHGWDKSRCKDGVGKILTD